MIDVVIHYAFTALICCACILSFAVRRTPLVSEPPLTETGRNLMIGGWAIFAARCIYLLHESGKLPFLPETIIGLSFVALGALLMSMAKLFEDTFDLSCIRAKAKTSYLGPINE